MFEGLYFKLFSGDIAVRVKGLHKETDLWFPSQLGHKI